MPPSSCSRMWQWNGNLPTMIGFVKGMPVNQLLKVAGTQLDPTTVSVLRERIQAL